MGLRTEVHNLGYLGECYVQLELAKRKINCQKLNDHMFSFDFILANGLRIEVKTSSGIIHKDNKTLDGKNYSYEREIFAFRNQIINRLVDYYVFVCINNQEEVDYYIIPAAEIGNRESLTIPVVPKGAREYKGSLLQWKNRWDLLTQGIEGIKE